MAFCTSCGRQAEPGVLFCTGCGARLRVPVAAQAEDPVPQAPPPQAPVLSSPAPPPPVRPASRPATHASKQRVRGPRPDAGLRRGGPGKTATTVIVLAVLVCGAAVAAFVVRSSPTNRVNLSSNKSSAAAPALSQPQQQPPTEASTQPPPTEPPAEQVAAQDLSQLLTQSASDRSAIIAAVNDVNACGSDLAADAQTFQGAASSRQDLLSQLSTLQDSSALPGQMLQDLNDAWQASVQADQDFAGWANDENSNGCTPDDSSDSNYRAATGPDDQATAAKQAFVNLWNPIASQYGLPAYQSNGL